MRNNTSEISELRWNVVKSMLDDFPELRERTVQYLKVKGKLTKIRQIDEEDQKIKRLYRRVLKEHAEGLHKTTA